jgi:transcriptional regulator with XRE-family HTH domain
VPRRVEPENRHPAALAFGAAVRSAREARGESIEAVADRIPRVGRNGLPVTMDVRTLGEIERGYHAPTIVTAKQIADALDVPLADLMRGL